LKKINAGQDADRHFQPHEQDNGLKSHFRKQKNTKLADRELQAVAIRGLAPARKGEQCHTSVQAGNGYNWLVPCRVYRYERRELHTRQRAIVCLLPMGERQWLSANE